MNPDKPSKIYFLFFLLTIVWAVYARLQYAFAERLWPDEALYAWYASQIFADPSRIFSKELIEFHPPLLAILLAAGHFFLAPEAADRAVSMIINVIGIFGMAILGQRTGGPFLGAFSALTLAFNIIYLNQSGHILLDSPLTVFLIFFMRSMTSLDKKKYPWEIGVLGAAVICLKWSGLVVVPILVIYALWVFRTLCWRERLRIISIPVSIMGICVLGLLVHHFVRWGNVLPDVTALEGLYLKRPFWYYAANLHNILMVPPLVILLFYGIWIALRHQEPSHKVFVTSLGVCFLTITLISEKDLRYSLMTLPGALLLAGVGLQDLLKRVFKTPKRIFAGELICLLGVGIFLVVLLPRTQKFLNYDARQFTGFKEAGQWVKAAANPEATIIAGSPRLVRYYSGIELIDFGGNIFPLPDKKDEFETNVLSAPGLVLLEIDDWERVRQPDWVYPFSREKMAYIKSLGFELEKTVIRASLADVGQSKEVIWLFRRN